MRRLHRLEIEQREPELLKQAVEWMAKLPFPAADVLIVDEIGKNISGTGMDTNVIGRKSNEHRALEHETPKVKKIVVRGLTAATHGNATGIGVADFTTQRVIDQIDYHAMRVNCVTSGRTAVGMLPIHYPTEQEAIGAALQTVGLVSPPNSLVMHIKNTLELEVVHCSTVYLDQLAEYPALEQVGPPAPMKFDDHGQLVAPANT